MFALCQFLNDLWLVGVAVRRYRDILMKIITFPYSTCINSFFGSSIPTSLFIFKNVFRSCFKKKKECQMAIFYFARRARKLRYYGDVIHSFEWKSAVERWWCIKCVIVYLAQDIPPFVMYCVYGESDSSLLIESTDSTI